MKKLCIVGVGWLGKQLVRVGLGKHLQLSGMGRTDPLITDFDFNEFHLSNSDLESLKGYLSYLDYMLFTIPPSGTSEYATHSIAFFKRLKELNPSIRLIFTSSTSVFGNSSGHFDEQSEVCPTSENANEIVEIEDYLQNEWKGRSSILRLGGLVGPQRHPIHFLAGRKGLSNGNWPVNLVHSQDVIHALTVLVNSSVLPALLHIVCPDHPSKESYYSWAARQLGLEIPQFKSDSDEKGKKVDSIYLKELKFDFAYQSVYSFLD